jgi:hypothetical protein
MLSLLLLFLLLLSLLPTWPRRCRRRAPAACHSTDACQRRAPCRALATDSVRRPTTTTTKVREYDRRARQWPRRRRAGRRMSRKAQRGRLSVAAAAATSQCKQARFAPRWPRLEITHSSHEVASLSSSPRPIINSKTTSTTAGRPAEPDARATTREEAACVAAADH